MLSKLFYTTLAIYLTTPVAAAPGTLTARQVSGPTECSLGFSPHCCDEVKQLPFNADVVVLDLGAGMGCTPVSIDDECERQTACCVSVVPWEDGPNHRVTSKRSYQSGARIWFITELWSPCLLVVASYHGPFILGSIASTGSLVPPSADCLHSCHRVEEGH
ncbi:hypothetical protein BKA70DRAFT_1222289 [Coprinopsis sp. MPI-PUGE-AT-0042]|nr:hypothetical protein BKA70DRAFT_1222289 [Coprinopsis sp. MPI-PUGE-AT-0042]